MSKQENIKDEKMNYEYTEIKISQYKNLTEFWNTIDEIELTIGDSKESLKNYLKRNPGLSYRCINKKEKKIIGTILCGHDGRRGYIYHLAVDKKYRGNSIGKILTELSISKLKSSGIKRCIIMVKQMNKSGSSFWKKMNWEKRDELMMYSKNL